MTSQVTDPRVARTRRDVVDTAAAVLVEHGWDGVTHAEIAKRSGYSKATIYAHWPQRIDLVRSAIDQICDVADHSAPTGDLRNDLRISLLDFAKDLDQGHLDRLLAGVIERAGTNELIQEMRDRLFETGTLGLRTILDAHLEPKDIQPTIALLTGAVLIRVSFEGKPATDVFISDLLDRVIKP